MGKGQGNGRDHRIAVGDSIGHFRRISDHRRNAGGPRLKLDLFRYIEGVIYFNPKIPNGALQLRMTEEELHCAQIAGLAINLSGLRTPHRVGAIKGRL
jgi:hypothetical protein